MNGIISVLCGAVLRDIRFVVCYVGGSTLLLAFRDAVQRCFRVVDVNCVSKLTFLFMSKGLMGALVSLIAC